MTQKINAGEICTVFCKLAGTKFIELNYSYGSIAVINFRDDIKKIGSLYLETVSYTHLTLPTTPYV